MAEWKINGADGSTKAHAHKIEYNGTWMGECYVSASVVSPVSVDFQIGDWLEYRGERFEINYDPTTLKSCASRTNTGAFKYDSIKLNSLSDELTRCDFLDVVTNDNRMHFTSLPTFSFYCASVEDLAKRIQANLDRLYTGDRKWKVEVYPEYAENTDVNISADNIKVWDALAFAESKFGAHFIIRGRTITIGTAGLPADHLFRMGEGNGLKSIEKTAESDQQIVTRLRVYGSTRNLPRRYYNSLTGADGKALIPDAMAVQNLMLPGFPDKTLDPYLDSPNIGILGVREGTVFFDGSDDDHPEIFPSIEEMTAAQLTAAGITTTAVGRLDELANAGQVTDNGVGSEENGEIVPGSDTFTITLKDIGFNINDYWTDETAVVSFKSGMLGGREFEIVSEGSDKPRQNTDKTWTFTLKRVYDESLQLFFPYKDYNAKAGDRFVLLHIDMPDVYIKAASQRLKEYGEKYLPKNDYARHSYTPEVDEVFMANQHRLAVKNPSVKSLHDTIKEGDLLVFEDADLSIGSASGGASIFIDQLVIKEGEKANPTYEVTLRNEKSVGSIEKIQNQIDSIKGSQGGGGYTAAQIRNLISLYGINMFLSKTRADRTPYRLSSDVGFEVGEYVGGASGAIMGVDAESGQSYAEVGKLMVRIKAYFESLTIINSASIGGKKYITPGGSVRISEVEEIRDSQGTQTGWRCWYLSEQDGEKTDCFLIPGDQAICEFFNAKTGTTNKVSNTYYWRKVTAVSNEGGTPPSKTGDTDSDNRYGWFVLSASDRIQGVECDAPSADDVVTQLGYDGRDKEHLDRQSAIVLSTVGISAPSVTLYSGIDTYSLSGRDMVSYGRDPMTGKAYFHSYGDMRLGARAEETDGSAIVFDEGLRKFILQNVALSVSSTIGGKTFEQYIQEVSPKVTKEDIEGFVNTIVAPDLDKIQKQIDGAIETWFSNGEPKLTTYPASDWNTEALREQHSGDLYYDNTTGTAYRFSKKADGTWYWNTITDDAITKALAAAKDAQDTADGKRRTFATAADTLPKPPYDAGDVWYNATYAPTYSNDILRCATSRKTGETAQISDWTLASKYTDDSLAKAAQKDAAAAQTAVTNLTTYVNGEFKKGLEDAFEDGIITATEKAELDGYINIINNTLASCKGTYDTLHGNAHLSGDAKTGLQNAYTDLSAKTAALVKAIQDAVADDKVTTQERTDVDNAFTAFNTSSEAFNAAVETANKAIQDVLKSYSDDALKNAKDAKEAADNAKTAADNAQTAADDANARLNEWAADGFISPTEKQGIKDEMARIDADKSQILSQYNQYQKYITGTTTAYTTAHKEYREVLESLCGKESWEDSIEIPDNFETLQGNYYTQRTLCLQRISLAADKYAKDLVDALEEAMNKNFAGYKYIKEALGNDSYTEGGLFLTSLIRLGTNNKGVIEQNVNAGINGIMNSSALGDGIALWLGGEQLDRFNTAGERIPQFPPGTRPASTLFRFDGTGYLAKGNLYWDADGAISAAKGNFRIDKNGGLHLGSGVYIGDDESETLGTILNFISMFNSLLIPEDSDGNPVTDLSKATRLHATVGLYSDKFLTALGLNPDGSQGAAVDLSGYAKIDWVKQYIADLDLGGKVDLSAYALKSEIPDISGKVDKVSGMGLSHNDFNDTYKSKLDGLSNYTLPTASASVKGGIKVGGGLAISSETLSVSLSASHIPTLDISKISGLQTALDGKQAKGSYLPLSGGTLTGVLGTIASNYTDAYGTGAINLNNSDIFNVNSIKFADLCDSAAEGLQWYRDGSHTDSMWVKNGVMYFTPNRPWGGTATDNVILHSGNISSYAITSHQALDHINNLGSLTAVSDTTTMPRGLRLHSVYSNGYPTTYGNLLRVGGMGSGELLCGWTADTSCGRLYYRSKRDVASTAWSGWNTLAFLSDLTWGNIASKPTTISGYGITDAYTKTEIGNNYLARSGGSMTNTNVVTNLNADLLDGVHASSLYQYSQSMWDAESVEAFAKRAFSGTPGLRSIHGWAWANSKYLTVGSYSLDCMRYSALHFRHGNLNNTWQQNAVMFLPTYSDSSMIYIAQMNTGATAGSVSTSVKRYADYDTIIGGNVASATRLQGSYSLWGQNFYGNNVSGDMTGVGNIKASGELSTTSANGFRIKYGNYGAFLRNDGSHTYLLLTNSGDSGGTWNSLRPLFVNDSNGNISLGNSALFVIHGGSVGIGTTSPAYKLDVAGDVRASGQFLRGGISSSWKDGRVNALLRATSSNGYSPLWSAKSTNGSWECGTYTSDILHISYITDANYNAGTNAQTADFQFNANGNLTIASLTTSGNAWLKGDVGIGNTSPRAGTLHLRKTLLCAYVSQFFTMTSDGSGDGLYFVPNTEEGEWNLALFAHNNMSYVKSTFRFFKSGKFWASDGVYTNGYVTAKNSSSDIRKKNVLAAAEIDLDTIARSPLVWFTWRDGSDPSRQIGTIAQYWERHLPEVVRTDNDGFFHVEYGVLATAMGVTLSRIVERSLPRLSLVETKVERLERENRELRTRIEKLEKIRI